MKRTPASLSRFVAKLIIWGIAFLLLWFTLSSLPFAKVLTVLGRLKAGQIAVLIMVNLLVVFCLSGRWWWILLTMGRKVSYLKLSIYRLAAYSVSYFTPGPQFGGEPFQVHLLQRRHAIPGSTAAAVVTLDKAIELAGNFTFLIFGLLVGLRQQFLPGVSGLPLLYAASGLLLTPLVLLAFAWSGKQPFTMALHRIPVSVGKRLPWIANAADAIQRTEEQISAFCCDRPQGLIGALAFNLLTWILLVGEYWLMSHYLGIDLNLLETITVLTAARLAFLTPLPGGIGALEASQVLALSALGYTSSEGLSLGILIRGRDLIFGVLGALLAVTITRSISREVTPSSQRNP